MIYVDYKKKFLPFILPAIILIIWYLLTDGLHLIPFYLLPSPINVFTAGWDLLSSGKLFMHTSSTLVKVFSGIILASVVAIPLGIILGWYETLDRLSSLIIRYRIIFSCICNIYWLCILCTCLYY